LDKAITTKVVIYCVDKGRLLVMRHPDFPPEEVGLQVPGGTVRAGEFLEAAALRELREETPHEGFIIEEHIGQDQYDISPYRYEIQHRHFFRARATETLPETWPAQEDHDRAQPPTRLEFFWLPLTQAHVLQSGLSRFIWKLADEN
jgi:8-oxo-dGTP pyrophosphatase MutT (NUDIX family)